MRIINSNLINRMVIMINNNTSSIQPVKIDRERPNCKMNINLNIMHQIILLNHLIDL